MLQKKRRQYNKEFKESAVKLVIEQNYKISEASRNLDIPKSALSRWVIAARGDNQSPESADIEKLQLELKQSCKEATRLRMERDILKKALGPSLPTIRTKISIY